MKQPQTAIIPDHCKAAIFIEANVALEKRSDIPRACSVVLVALSELQTQFPDSVLGLTIGFGSELWKAFGHAGEGAEIKPFRALGGGLAPATQHDVLFHIQSMRPDVNFALAMKLVEIFEGIIDVRDETHGFRWIEDRGLDGFVDGTENPQGDENVANVALIPGDREDEGGSYVMVQKYRHDLHKWKQVPLEEQEASVGRSKVENEEFSKEVRRADSHLGRVNIKENGVGLKIVRRSLPFGKASGEHGLMFIAYCRTLHNIEAQLLSMFGEADGKTDLLLKYVTLPVSGAYYYAPSVDRLKAL